MPIKTFRGLIADGGQDKIVLHTNNGSVGYKIKKFQIFPKTPGHTTSSESTVQLFTVEQATVPTTNPEVDFNDPTLLGVAYYQDHVDAAYPGSIDVVFDNMTFNQDIYVVHTSSTSSGVDGSMNYYIELEKFTLDLNQNTVATLKDIRNERQTI
mgnify:CR=1 FL=1